MKKTLMFLILLTILGGTFFLLNNFSDYSPRMLLRLPEVEKEVTVFVQEIEKKIITSKPLKAAEEGKQSFLTQTGIIEQTNIQREKHGLSPFQESTELNDAALLKVEDMMSGQYFDHVSPSGEGVGDLAKLAGYEFIAIGENLALGNFQDDEVLVQGWMDSPGHRDNILNLQYQEIGVAVLRGEFEGRTTWLAVQHFGLPLTACPQPSEALELEIAEKQNQLEELQKVLSALKQEIEDMRPKRGQAYSQKIEQYNDSVVQHNALIVRMQDLVDRYNYQVVLFNECAAGL